MENKEPFEYTYSAPEREELQRIREKYLPRDQREEQLAAIRRLDAGVEKKAAGIASLEGLASTLVMGVGMCCCLVWTDLFILGIVLGLAGMMGMALAYPLHGWVIRRERARVAPEILRLTQELL